MKSCIIPICGNSSEMKGKYFLTYVENTSYFFEKAHFVLCDGLDTYNLAPKNSPLWQEAETIAKQMGDRWLEKHHSLIKIFFKETTLVRWSDVRSDPCFQKKYALSKKLYKNSEHVQNWVNKVCKDYVEVAAKRNSARGLKTNFEKKLVMSIDYMLEEIAGTSVYYNWYKCPAIYPGQYFEDSNFFNRYNNVDNTIDLTVPKHIWPDDLVCNSYQKLA